MSSPNDAVKRSLFRTLGTVGLWFAVLVGVPPILLVAATGADPHTLTVSSLLLLCACLLGAMSLHMRRRLEEAPAPLQIALAVVLLVLVVVNGWERWRELF